MTSQSYRGGTSRAAVIAMLLFLAAPAAARSASRPGPAVLTGQALKHYVERFNANDNPEINQLMAELPEQAKIFTVGFEEKRDDFVLLQ